MIRWGLFGLLTGVLTLTYGAAVADDLTQTSATAAVCSGCHSRATENIPRIDGLSADEIAESLRTSRTSETVTVMNRLARGLSDEDIDAIAAHLAKQE